jgi:transposase
MRRDKRSYRQLGEDLGVHQDTLRDWYNKAVGNKKPKKRAKGASQPQAAVESPEQRLARLERENARLRKENESLKMDREILKKAAAFFAKESE